jgi:hypothetical protein
MKTLGIVIAVIGIFLLLWTGAPGWFTVVLIGVLLPEITIRIKAYFNYPR